MSSPRQSAPYTLIHDIRKHPEVLEVYQIRGLLTEPGMQFIPKLHTARWDGTERWKVGSKIHFVINNRTKDQYTFATAECLGIQDIEIIPSTSPISAMPDIIIDGRLLSYNERSMFITNDGFPEEGMEHFNAWFKEPFKGRLIHWTNFKY